MWLTSTIDKHKMEKSSNGKSGVIYTTDSGINKTQNSNSDRDQDIEQGTIVTYLSDLDEADFKKDANLQQGLDSRHIQMIALGGTIGTGLFIGISTSLRKCGPAGLLTSYLILSTILYFVANELGELTCYLPARNGIIANLVHRYVDESLAFATGWLYYYNYVIIVCAEVTACALIVQYWTTAVPVAAWITIFLVVIICLNFLAVKYYGEAEFWFASLKILCIIGLIIVGIVIFFGGAPKSNGVLGFHYWKHPGAFAEHLAHGNTAKFLDVWFGVIQGGYAFVTGPEYVALTAGESKNARYNIQKATKRFVARLLMFYVCGSLVVGVTVAYNDPKLTGSNTSAAASPYVIGIQNFGIKILNHIVNAVLLSSAWSAGNSSFYGASRTLLALSKSNSAPKFFNKVNRMGVPYLTCIMTAVLTPIAYLNVSNSTTKVFTWFSNIVTIAGFIGWILIGISYLRFRKAAMYNNVWDRTPFKTPFQPYATYYTIGILTVITITNGFEVFFDFNGSDFVAAYITLPFFFSMYFGHKIFTRNWKWGYSIEEIDVTTGLDEAEARQAVDEKTAQVPTTPWQKFLHWLL